MQTVHFFAQITEQGFSLYRFCHSYHIFDKFLFVDLLCSHVHQCRHLQMTSTFRQIIRRNQIQKKNINKLKEIKLRIFHMGKL